MQAEALVRARPEGEVATGAPRRIEPARIVEHAGIVVGGDIVHHQPVALGDGLPADFGVFRRRAREVLHRSGPADRFFDDPAVSLAK